MRLLVVLFCAFMCTIAAASTVANDDSYTAYTGQLLSVDVANGVLANDTGTSGYYAVLVQNAVNGSVSLNADGSFTYTPNAGFKGMDVFTYQVFNGSTASNNANVFVNVDPTPALAAISMVSPAILGGRATAVRVILNSPAPAGGVTVSLLSSSPSVVTVPQTIKVPAGAMSVNAPATTTSVTRETGVTVTGTYNGVNKTTAFYVEPIAPAKIEFSLQRIAGGKVDTCGVYLDAVAPAGGLTVQMTTTSNAVVLPPTVFIPAGQICAGFRFQTVRVMSDTDVPFTATLNGQTKTAYLTVLSPRIVGFQFISDVVGGNGAAVELTLDYGFNAAPTTNIPVHFDYSVPGIVSFPSDSHIFGQSKLFILTFKTTAVNNQTNVNVTAHIGSVSSTATLTVLPNSISITPDNGIGGGLNSFTALKIAAPLTTNQKATLTSSDPVLQVPSPVTVLAGKNAAYIPYVTALTDVDKTVTLTATVGAMTATATTIVHAASLGSLIVNPGGFGGPNPIHGGTIVSGEVDLQLFAGPSGATVTLTSSDPSLKVPPSVTVAPGHYNATFTATAGKVSAGIGVTVTASYKGISKSYNVPTMP